MNVFYELHLTVCLSIRVYIYFYGDGWVLYFALVIFETIMLYFYATYVRSVHWLLVNSLLSQNQWGIVTTDT